MLTHSIVIITKDRPDELAALLKNLAQQTLSPDDVIVVDAGGSGMAGVRPADLPYRLSHLKALPDICEQKNIGLRAAPGDIITFLDDDVLPESDYCAHVLARFAEDRSTSIGAIGGFLTNPVRQSLPELLFRRLFRLQTGAGHHAFLLSGYPDTGYGPAVEINASFLSSTALSLRREAIGTLAFDGDRFTGRAIGLSTGRGFGEDVVFTFELGHRYTLIVLPSARYVHTPSPRNRENTAVTQALYVYALRVISRDHASSQAARLWALFGQGVLCAVQTLAYQDVGYVKGFVTAMRSPLQP